MNYPAGAPYSARYYLVQTMKIFICKSNKKIIRSIKDPSIFVMVNYESFSGQAPALTE